jgi:hypothetical protein
LFACKNCLKKEVRNVMFYAIPYIGWLLAEPFWLFGWVINLIPVIGVPLYDAMIGFVL